jgi:hypothetical protein
MAYFTQKLYSMKRLIIAVTAILMVSLFAFGGDPKPKSKRSSKIEQPPINDGCQYYIACNATWYDSGGSGHICANPVRAPFIHCSSHGGQSCY